MSSVQIITVSNDDGGMRLDRWFRREFPQVTHGRLEKLLRQGYIRVDGKRAKAAQRLAGGEAVRVPPLPEGAAEAGPSRPILREEDARAMHDLVLYRDEDVLVINKPPGLAVQGGSGVKQHLDGLLDALRFDADERPRLVHRLDKDTSGVLVLARTAPAARALAAAFRSKETRKLYWTICVGSPAYEGGRIDQALVKREDGKVEAVAEATPGARHAVSLFRVEDRVGRQAAWLSMSPLTGRTHQLRVHAAVIGTPLLGDGKYGGAQAFLPMEAIAKRLHLHARRIVMPHPRVQSRAKAVIDVTAPLPAHMEATWRTLGFEAGDPAASEMI